MNQRLRVPHDLRPQLEIARLDLLALFRALDQLTLMDEEFPQEELRDLFELDGDFAEALHVMDTPPPFRINITAMVRDTLASLEALPEVRDTFLALLPASAQQPLASLQRKIRQALVTQDAYNGIPGKDPQSC